MSSANATTETLVLRLAGADDAYHVRRLAALDDAPSPDGQTLLALIDGEAVAALSLRDGRVVANPFLPTEEVVSLLRLRASQMSPPRPLRRWRWGAVLRPRFV